MLLAAAALYAIAFGLLAAAVLGGGPLPIDPSIRDMLGVGGRVPAVLQALNDVGGATIWDVGVAIVAGVLALTRRRREALWLGGSVLAGEAISTVAKLIVDRQRPPGVAVQDLVTQASFPSGHATRGLITAALLVLLLARGRWTRAGGAIAVIVFTLLLGVARVLSGEHWPTDVLGAWLLGGAIVAVVAAVPRRLRASEPARPRPEPLASPGAAPPP